jgi:FkbM family methyltransferase
MIKKAFFKALDILTGGRGIQRKYSDNQVRIPSRYFRYFNEDYEKQNIRLITEKVGDGMVVFDIGAHIGLMSVILAQKVGDTGKVFSFEPTPATFEVLRNTIRINDLENVIVPVQAALSSKSGKAMFYISDDMADSSNSLVNYRGGKRNERPTEVQLYAMDDYVDNKNLQSVDFIKIDAEGAELEVLQGSEKTLQRFRPSVILALHPEALTKSGHSLKEIWNFTDRLNYEVFLDSQRVSSDSFISKNGLFDVFLSPKPEPGRSNR